MESQNTPTVALERPWRVGLEEAGINTENVLRRAELPLDLLHQEPARVSVPEYFRFWDALVAEANDPRLPIRMAEALSPEIFHPAVFSALCSPNLVVAAKRVGEYKRLCAPVTILQEPGEDGFFVGFHWENPEWVLPDALAAVELCWFTQMVRVALRDFVVPVAVESPYPLEPLDAYTEYFGVMPQRTERHGVTFSRADAERPFLTASEDLWNSFEPELRRRLTSLDAGVSVSQRVRSILLESLPAGEASIEATAKRLGLGARTLQRRLKPEGVSYKDVVRETREQLSRHYLTATTLTYNEISFLVGFDEPSSFFRAFREWTGATPEAVRKEAVA